VANSSSSGGHGLVKSLDMLSHGYREPSCRLRPSILPQLSSFCLHTLNVTELVGYYTVFEEMLDASIILMRILLIRSGGCWSHDQIVQLMVLGSNMVPAHKLPSCFPLGQSGRDGAIIPSLGLENATRRWHERLVCVVCVVHAHKSAILLLVLLFMVMAVVG
jgi:hypothetical protein